MATANHQASTRQTNREIHLASRPEGLPTEANFRLVENPLPATGPGQVLIKNLYMSVDPAMRPPLTNGQTKLDEVMTAGALGKIVESQLDGYPAGTYVMHRGGFREWCLSNGQGLEIIEPENEPLTA